MRIYEIRQKEVINIVNCQKIGFVCDINFDPKSGCIESLIVPGPCKLWGVLGRDQEYIIPFCQVKHIGPDVILVEIEEKECLSKGKYV